MMSVSTMPPPGIAQWLHDHSHGLIAAAALVGLVARLSFGIFYWVDKPLTHDELEYLELAGNLADGQGLRYDALPSQSPDDVPFQRFDRAPGYPAFLAAVSFSGASITHAGSTPIAVKVVQAFVGAIGVVIIGLLAARAWNPAAGVIAAIGAAVHPPLVWISAYALSEALYSVLALACALVLVHATGAMPETVGRRISGTALALSGVLAGIAALVRPVGLLCIALYAGWLCVRRAPLYAMVFAMGVVVVIAPWTLRSSERAQRFVLIATEGGVTFWTGNHPLARGEGDLAANPVLKDAEIEFRRRHRGLSPDALEPIYYREALQYIQANPLGWLMLMARKLAYQWIPIGPSYRLHSWLYAGASIASYLVVLPFAIAGLLHLRRAGRMPVVLALLAGSPILAGLIFFPQERFRIPVIDPVLLIFGAVWVASRLGEAHSEVTVPVDADVPIPRSVAS